MAARYRRNRVKHTKVAGRFITSSDAQHPVDRHRSVPRVGTRDACLRARKADGWMGSVLCGAACVGYGRCGYIWDRLMWSGPPQRPAGTRRQGARGEVIGFGPGKTCEAENDRVHGVCEIRLTNQFFLRCNSDFCVCWPLSAPSMTVLCVCVSVCHDILSLPVSLMICIGLKHTSEIHVSASNQHLIP